MYEKLGAHLDQSNLVNFEIHASENVKLVGLIKVDILIVF